MITGWSLRYEAPAAIVGEASLPAWRLLQILQRLASAIVAECGGGNMTETMWKVLQLLIKRRFDGIGYSSTWSMSKELNIELAGCGVPYGDPALEKLVELGLIEELPDLGCRYRIVVTDGAE